MSTIGNFMPVKHTSTPRTDSAQSVQPHPSGGHFVPIDLCRTLELELAEARLALGFEEEHSKRYAGQVQRIVEILLLSPSAHFQSIEQAIQANQADILLHSLLRNDLAAALLLSAPPRSREGNAQLVGAVLEWKTGR